jgi:hypothetical protein
MVDPLLGFSQRHPSRAFVWCREHNISPRDANLFLSSQGGEGTFFENRNIAGLDKGQNVRDVIFSGEGIVMADEDPSILTDLGFV